MQDNYYISFDKIPEAIIKARAAGCNPMIYINGEYYEIKPDTIPNQDTEKSENLPF